MSDFTHYIVVDWSASSCPRRGSDSIWIAMAGRAGIGLNVTNPATRAVATAWLQEMLLALVGADESVLLGFDFPYGYPAGFAEALSGPGAGWHDVWERISVEV